MTKRDIELRQEVLKQQLTLINLYSDDFLERLGKKGLEHYIDEILDEMNYLDKQLKKYEDD
ncbi:MAG: hypothetical protein AAF960_23385 [Bacteroidota bacterium]